MAMLRLASYNLLHGLVPADGTARADRLKAAVREIDADVLALQEVDRRQPRSDDVDQVAAVATALEARWRRFVPTVIGTPAVPGWVAATQDDGDLVEGPSYGVGLVSRFPVRSWAVQRFRPAPGRLPLVVAGSGRPRVALVPDEPRVGLAAVIDGPHGSFTVIATHLSFVPGYNVGQLRRLASWARTFPAPVFLAGDLNLPGALPARVTKLTQLVKGATYPSSRPRVQLDHVLAYQLRPDQVRGQHVWTLPVSDHRAVSADVEL